MDRWQSLGEFFTGAQAHYDDWRSYIARELMLKYSKDDAYLHLRDCRYDAPYPRRFWVAGNIDNTLKYGTDMLPWTVY